MRRRGHAPSRRRTDSPADFGNAGAGRGDEDEVITGCGKIDVRGPGTAVCAGGERHRGHRGGEQNDRSVKLFERHRVARSIARPGPPPDRTGLESGRPYDRPCPRARPGFEEKAGTGGAMIAPISEAASIAFRCPVWSGVSHTIKTRRRLSLRQTCRPRQQVRRAPRRCAVRADIAHTS